MHYKSLLHEQQPLGSRSRINPAHAHPRMPSLLMTIRHFCSWGLFACSRNLGFTQGGATSYKPQIRRVISSPQLLGDKKQGLCVWLQNTSPETPLNTVEFSSSAWPLLNAQQYLNGTERCFVLLALVHANPFVQNTPCFILGCCNPVRSEPDTAFWHCTCLPTESRQHIFPLLNTNKWWTVYQTD